MGHEDAQVLAPAIAANGGLTKISLAANKLEEEGAKAICEALKVNKTLKELDMSGDRVEGSNIGKAAGAKNLADMLTVNGGLTSLNVDINGLGDEGKSAIRKAVEGREGFDLKM